MTRIKVQVLFSECRLMTYGYLTDNFLSRPSIKMITNWETLIKKTKTIKKTPPEYRPYVYVSKMTLLEFPIINGLKI